MKHLIVLMLFLAAISWLSAQDTQPQPVLKTTILSHLPMDGSARIGLELPVEGTSWAIEPMVGVRYFDYWNERDLRFSPEARVAAYRYQLHPKKDAIIRTGLALQYRLMHSNETHRVCLAEQASEWSDNTTCTEYGYNDYRRLSHQIQAGMLYGRRYHIGQMLLDVDVIAGLQFIAVETPGLFGRGPRDPVDRSEL